jgi:hypothetical protein
LLPWPRSGRVARGVLRGGIRFDRNRVEVRSGWVPTTFAGKLAPTDSVRERTESATRPARQKRGSEGGGSRREAR